MMSYLLVIVLACFGLISAIPSNVNVSPVSRTAVRITWHQDWSPQLKGFTIHYHNGDVHQTEWLTKTVWDARAKEAIIDGLRTQGEYSFCVRSIMTGKVCACSEQVHFSMARGQPTTGDQGGDRDQHGQQGQQGQHHGQQQGSSGVHALEVGSIGGDYVQIRWRYDGPRPVKYVVTYRGFQRYEIHDGQFEEQEVDIGAPVELDVEQYVAQNLRPDTTYRFEVAAVDMERRPVGSSSQTIQVITKAYIL